IASKVVFTSLTFKPMTAASAFTRSGSIPITVWPSGAMNSLGAYCASVPTVRGPLALIVAGTCAAIAALTLAVGAVVGVLALDERLPRPQAASSDAGSGRAPAPRAGPCLTPSDAARCPSSKDFSSSRGRPVLRRRPPAARDAPAAAEAAGFAAAFVPALRLAFVPALRFAAVAGLRVVE